MPRAIRKLIYYSPFFNNAKVIKKKILWHHQSALWFRKKVHYWEVTKMTSLSLFYHLSQSLTLFKHAIKLAGQTRAGWGLDLTWDDPTQPDSHRVSKFFYLTQEIKKTRMTQQLQISTWGRLKKFLNISVDPTWLKLSWRQKNQPDSTSEIFNPKPLGHTLDFYTMHSSILRALCTSTVYHLQCMSRRVHCSLWLPSRWA